MVKRIAPNTRGDGFRVGIVLSRFNAPIGDGLLAGAQRALAECGVADDDVTLVTVPGALETPLALQRMAQSGDFDGLIALGAVIRGGTPHFEYVAGECVKGMAQVTLKHGVPIAFGVLTVDTIEQAIERAGTKAGNKGAEAALAALEMASLYGKLG